MLCKAMHDAIHELPDEIGPKFAGITGDQLFPMLIGMHEENFVIKEMTQI